MAWEVFQACPRKHWRDHSSQLAWECLGVSPRELEVVAREREVWASLLRLQISGKNGWMNG